MGRASIDDQSNMWGVQATKDSSDSDVFLGLGNGKSGGDMTKILYGVFIQAKTHQVIVYEKQNFITNLGAIKLTDTVGVRLAGTASKATHIEYLLNGEVKYQRKVTPVLPLRVEVGLYNRGDSLSNFKYISRSGVLCETVTCDPTPKCHVAQSCHLGKCPTQFATMKDGTGCNDDDKRTDDDVCLQGVCQGIDKCDGKTCPQPNTRTQQCLMQQDKGGCANGECLPFVNKPTTETCSDGDDETSNDHCRTDGTCKGTNFCENKECAQQTMCTVNHTIKHSARLRGFKIVPHILI